MLGRRYESQNCSAARALESVGERWSILIIRNALYAGMTRFSEFQQSLGIATNVLSARLERFVADGIMEPAGGEISAAHRSYRLTEKGRDLGPVIMTLTEWGDRWAAPAGPPVLYEHATCGHPVHTTIPCPACGRAVAPAEVSAAPGPGADPEAATRIASRRAAAHT